ncbi:DUF362 domain-containing protein [Elusimicrobiota bacterium]
MSDVYFISRRSTLNSSLMDKLKKLINKTDIRSVLKENDMVAVKLHFGEPGLTTFLRPVFVKPFTDLIKECSARPFLTDASTIYQGSRANGVEHLEVAIKNGFSYTVTGAPIIIADGIDGRDCEEVIINKNYYKKVKVAGETHRANAMIVLSHFKGHEMFSFGGAVKNIGMGLASKEGKLSLHSTSSPYIKIDKCTKCSICIKWCPADAIEISEENAQINDNCTGCGYCIMACPAHAITLKWDSEFQESLRRTAEYALGTVEPKRDKIWFFNFLMEITPECDCYRFSDSALAPDIGILASKDPVSIDQASYDLVNNAPVLPDSKAEGLKPGEDKFKAAYPKTNPEPLFKHAEKIGLGERKYKLINI